MPRRKAFKELRRLNRTDDTGVVSGVASTTKVDRYIQRKIMAVSPLITRFGARRIYTLEISSQFMSQIDYIVQAIGTYLPEFSVAPTHTPVSGLKLIPKP